MKKQSLLYSLLFVVAVGFLASCGKDDDPKPKPTVSFIPNQDKATVAPGSSFDLSVTYEAEQKLKSITVHKKEGNTEQTHIAAKTSGFNSDTKHIEVYQLDAPSSGSYEYRFEVEDKDGSRTSKTFTVTADETVEETTLSAPSSFEWRRVGSANGTGLSDFGLAWTSNSSAGAAVIKKDADKLVVLSAADWTGITTQEALKAKIDAASSVDDFRGIETGATKTYNHVIGTKKGNEYFLINITNAQVTTGGTSGTTIVITGQSKK